jgi:hypothetical protein
MTNKIASLIAALVLIGVLDSGNGYAYRPAPPPSRYLYELSFDALPKGVSIRAVGEGESRSYLVTNAGDIPLIVNERFDGRGEREWGEKLVSGTALHYFRDGVPQAGRENEKGWVKTVLTEAQLTSREAEDVVAQGREPGLKGSVPPKRSFIIDATYGGKPYAITGTVTFRLNPAYKARQK